MNADRVFADTNVLVYLYSTSSEDEVKRLLAYDALKQHKCLISTQVLNEFSNFCIKKLKISTERIQIYVSQIRAGSDLSYIDENTISLALNVHKKYGYSYYDSLMIASALEHNCTYLLSEDMADGQVIEGTLTIKNIFA